MSEFSNEYTNLVAGAHFDKPLFKRWIYELTQPQLIARQRLEQLQEDFDVDLAVGLQLDAIGVRVGVSRYLPVKLTDIYFAFDDVDGIGFDFGVWRGRFDPEDGMTRLDDSTYRAVIKAKILQNRWDGTNGTLPEFLSTALSYFGVDSKVLDMQDFQTMTVALHLTKRTTPPIVWELFQKRIVDIVSAGVGLKIVKNDPWFGFDYETGSVKGFDGGAWFPFDEKENQNG